MVPHGWGDYGNGVTNESVAAYKFVSSVQGGLRGRRWQLRNGGGG